MGPMVSAQSCLFMLGILEELKKHKDSLWPTAFTLAYVRVQVACRAVHEKG